MKLRIILTYAISFFCTSLFAQTSDRDKGLIAFDAKDYKLAVATLTPFAEKGDCVAQFAVGFAYSTDIIKNDSLAMRWLLLAAEQKQPNAMGPLGVLYFGSDIEGANTKAYLWVMLAAEYEPKQRATSARVLIKSYLKPDELIEANKLISEYKEKWKNKEKL